LLSAWQDSWGHHPVAVFNRHSLCKRRFGLLPLHTAPAVGCAALRYSILLKGEYLFRVVPLICGGNDFEGESSQTEYIISS